MSDFTATPGHLSATPPSPTPPKISLLTAADVASDNELGPMGRGYTYAPETCSDGTIGAICVEPGTVTKAPAENVADAVTIDPFGLWAADQCSAFALMERDFYGRAERNLLAVESSLIEKALMLNPLGINHPWILNPANTFIEATTAAVSPKHALARLEQAVSNTLRGRLLIHVRPVVLDLLVASQSIRREGNVWLTPLDNIVVPGRGYTGVGPEEGETVSATSEWIYATTMVRIRRGPIFFTPGQDKKTEGNPNGIPQSAVNRQWNDVTVHAERLATVDFDPSCGVGVAQVNPSL